jgi:ABC-type transport system involved in cytochrome bd biosynthesis fused ATPase/permease subunit
MRARKSTNRAEICRPLTQTAKEANVRIKSVRIKNLRLIADQTVEFDRYNCLVGANGAGKSTVLCALNVFFRETQNATTDLTQYCSLRQMSRTYLWATKASDGLSGSVGCMLAVQRWLA